MVNGFYTLELGCDAFTVRSLAQVVTCDVKEEVIAETRMHAREKARVAGWLLTMRGDKCFCEVHAAERRQQRRSAS